MMDESHFEHTGARVFKYSFFAVVIAITCIGLWQKEAILGYFSFREHGESRIVIYAEAGTKVSVVETGNKLRELGFVGRDGRFTLVEKGEIKGVRINLNHPHYFSEDRHFDLVEKGEVAVFQSAMVPLLGSLSVRTFPTGAKVLIDGKDEGLSPLRKLNIRDGKRFLVEVRLKGYISQNRDAVIEGGKTAELVFSLVSSQATISLETNKSDFDFSKLRLFMGGESYALDGQLLRNVKPGKHTIEVVAHDGLKLEKVINIKPGQTLHMQLPDWFVED
ncbi:MAG: PEGA domain-containing protein [Verrucomicrobia bacterium]|nr:PEGA domain-containing protein [Verrucomicrobiota bacterium]MDA1067718.1 PEGA domain-containing protein [Verrucomicrobiota bacterium]